MNVPEWISAIAAIIALVVAAVSTYLHVKMRAELAEFRNLLIEYMDDRFIRKPDQAEDYFVSRRELGLRLKSDARRP